MVLPPLPGIHLAPCTRTRAHCGGSLACSPVPPDLHQRRVSCSISAFWLGFNDVHPEARFLDDETHAHIFVHVFVHVFGKAVHFVDACGHD